MACLRDIKRLFVDRNPFYAGFGNRLTDGLSYRSVEIPSSRIFTIDSYGNVKLELLELAGYTSTYIAMTNLVNETFPPVQKSGQPQFNDFNYWRSILPELDLPDFILAPLSPTLSARSESRMSVFRVGAIAGALSKRSSKNQLKPSNAVLGEMDIKGNRSPLSTSPRTSSPSPLQATYRLSEDDDENVELGLHNKKSQAKSIEEPSRRRRDDSMPGSFEENSYFAKIPDRSASHRGNVEDVSFSQGDAETMEFGDEYQEKDEDDLDLEVGEMNLEDDDLPEMDFGNVPVCITYPILWFLIY